MDVVYTSGISAALMALVAWLIARRQTSGQVATTDANRLWDQNMMLIKAYAEDNGALRARCDHLEQRLHTAEERERTCLEQSHTQQIQIQRLERMMAADGPPVTPARGAM